jgi:DNA-binding XRE family transcriptional regulator
VVFFIFFSYRNAKDPAAGRPLGSPNIIQKNIYKILLFKKIDTRCLLISGECIEIDTVCTARRPGSQCSVFYIRSKTHILAKIRINRLRVVLVDLRLKQKDLAALLGVTPGTVSLWCTNKQQPSLPMLFRIAETLRVGICLLLVSTPWENEHGPSPVDIFKMKRDAKRK